MDFFRKAAPPPPPPVEVPIKDAAPLHPFYPLGVEIVNYLANDKDVIQLLTSFAIGCTVILSMTWLVASTFGPQLKRTDKLVVLWFMLSKKWESLYSWRRRTPTDNWTSWIHTSLFRGLLLL